MNERCETGMRGVYALGDLTGDGKVDVIVGGLGQHHVSVLANRGDGRFQEPVHYKIGRLPHYMALRDFNRDMDFEAEEGVIVADTDPASPARAGVFRLRLDSDRRAARRVERLVAWRCRTLGLPWGDQGLLIHADLLATIGGYPEIPLMEDVRLVRRIGRRRLTMLDADAVTSAARYERDGWWARPLRNAVLLTLHFLGVPPRILLRLYG